MSQSLLLLFVLITSPCVCHTGETSFGIKTEADGNSITEQPYVDEPLKDLAVHSRIYKGKKLHKCHTCDKTFMQYSQLNTHMRIHSGDKPYKCLLCDKSFCEPRSLEVHERYVHRQLVCRHCEKVFETKESLKQHVRTHTGAKPYSCRHCSECFTWHSQLKQHLLESHNEHTGTWFICHICQKKFVQSSALASHVRRNECMTAEDNTDGAKPFSCTHCSKRFTHRYQLKRHLLKTHNEGISFTCRICRKKFSENTSLKSHIKSHTLQQKHLKARNNTAVKPYSCTHCSDRFTSKYQLKRHLLESHDEGTWFTCHICQKKFCLSCNLKDHVRRHEGIKPYVCCECLKRFCTANELKQHQPAHSDEKQFRCNLCSKFFKRKSAVSGHMETCAWI